MAKHERNPPSVLEQEIAAIRANSLEPGHFSDERRERVVRLAHRAAQEKAPAGSRAWIGLLAGAAAAVCVLALWVGRPSAPLQLTDLGADPRIEVQKRGEHVVFNLRNGSRVHTVTVSENPRHFTPESEERVENGSFTDRLDRGPQLVFYRIE